MQLWQLPILHDALGVKGFHLFYELVDEMVGLAGEDDQGPGQAELIGIPSMGVEVKVSSETITPELVELPDKGV